MMFDEMIAQKLVGVFDQAPELGRYKYEKHFMYILIFIIEIEFVELWKIRINLSKEQDSQWIKLALPVEISKKFLEISNVGVFTRKSLKRIVHKHGIH